MDKEAQDSKREEIKMLDKLNQKTMFGKLNQNKKKNI